MTRAALTAAAIFSLALAGCAPPTNEEAEGQGLSTEDISQVPCPNVDIPPVSIETIVKAYADNEAAAQKRFGGKCTLVSGVVVDVTLDASDEPVIALSSDDLFSPTIELLDANVDQAAVLKKGKIALFFCNDTSEFLGSPSLTGCFVVEDTASTGQ